MEVFTPQKLSDAFQKAGCEHSPGHHYLFPALTTICYIRCLLSICLLFPLLSNISFLREELSVCSLLALQNLEDCQAQRKCSKIFLHEGILLGNICAVKFICHWPSTSSLETAGFALGSCVIWPCWPWIPDLSWTSEHS